MPANAHFFGQTSEVNGKNMWKANQRLLSQTEPELGLGLVVKVDIKNGTLEVLYPEANSKRLYSLTRAPIRRFALQVGQKGFDANAKAFVVDGIEKVALVGPTPGRHVAPRRWLNCLHMPVE